MNILDLDLIKSYHFSETSNLEPLKVTVDFKNAWEMDPELFSEYSLHVNNTNYLLECCHWMKFRKNQLTYDWRMILIDKSIRLDRIWIENTQPYFSFSEGKSVDIDQGGVILLNDKYELNDFLGKISKFTSIRPSYKFNNITGSFRGTLRDVFKKWAEKIGFDYKWNHSINKIVKI